MRALVLWDDQSEADLIAQFLTAGEHEVELVTSVETAKEILNGSIRYEVLLLHTGDPGDSERFDLFLRFRKAWPDCCIVGACAPHDVFHIARYLTNGMRSYVLRDAGGDYVFLLQATLEGAVEAVRAERERIFAEKLRGEIESVRRLQESIIPHDFVCPKGYGIQARYEPSQIQSVDGRPLIMAGGDYYDLFLLDDENVMILVGDASGHGMKACMSIMTMHTLVRMIRSRRYDKTAEFVAEVNRQLCEQSIVQSEGGFITLLYGILRTRTNEFEWSSAGHPVPLIHDKSGEIRPATEHDVAGLPLAISADAEYETCVTKLEPGQRLLLYTDGLVEAFPEGVDPHQEFGVDGIERTLQSFRERPLEDALGALFHESNAFTKGSGRHDDTSVVLVERT